MKVSEPKTLKVASLNVNGGLDDKADVLEHYRQTGNFDILILLETKGRFNECRHLLREGEKVINLEPLSIGDRYKWGGIAMIMRAGLQYEVLDICRPGRVEEEDPEQGLPILTNVTPNLFNTEEEVFYEVPVSYTHLTLPTKA